MGDDTWNTIYADAFAEDMRFPYDSFNVEDLDTVDTGVITHLFPLMANTSADWDVMIGHFLGVDHVGHRVGPDHPKMRAKLAQMDQVLRQVVHRLADDTLLVVLGDHGMDRRGDHGGDGLLETAAALWVYSNTPLRFGRGSASLLPLPTRVFPGATVPHRFVQQIDLVPSLALLLGIPIPYNNLGTVIPELFGRYGQLERALELNVKQVKRYLDTYRASSSGAELDAAWDTLQERYAAVQNAQGDETQWVAMEAYTRSALAACRELWAQFNVTLIGLGLTVLVVGAIAAVMLYTQFGELKDNWEEWAAKTRWLCVRGMAAGSVLGFLSYFALRSSVKGVDALDSVIFGAPLVSSLVVIASTRPSLSSLRPPPSLLLLLLHAAAFASNSFTVWEDRILTYLLLSTVAPSVRAGLAAPTARLRARILGFSALFAGCVRAMAASTVCREEQHPFCHVTFFASSSLPEPPALVLALAVPAALALPHAVRRVLRTSKSDNGVAEIVLPWLLPVVLLQGAAHWIAEWLDSADVLGEEWHWILRAGRTVMAQGAMGSVVIFGILVWWYHPLCLSVSATETGADGAGKEKKTQVTILGFGNTFGASYLVLWCAVLGILYTTTQLTGQLVLVLTVLAVLAHVEVVDSVRDVRALEAAFASQNPSAALQAEGRPTEAVKFSEILPLALLALHAFYRTGHQSTIVSMQWKAAFVLTPTLSYWLSLATVVMNTLGPPFLLALAVPLVALWNVEPTPHPAASAFVTGGAVRAALGMMLYHSALLLGSAASSAWLRRHLMVWKIFAPRFMNAAATMIAVDVAVLLGVGFGVGRITSQADKLFGGMGQRQAEDAQEKKSTK